MPSKDILREARRLAATIQRIYSTAGRLTYMQQATLLRARVQAQRLAGRLAGDPAAAREVMVLRFLADIGEVARLH